MVMTVVEAHVGKDKWAVLESEYRALIQRLEPGLLRTYLVQSLADPTLWRLIGFWASLEALEQMRASQETPRGVLIFRAAGAEPELARYHVVAEATHRL